MHHPPHRGPAGPASPTVLSRSRNLLPVWLAVVAVLIVAAGVALFVARSETDETGTSLPTGTSTVAPASPPQTGAQRSQPAAVPPGVALDRQVAADRDTAESLAGSWVPQLSSRRVGMVIDGETVDDDAIVRDFATSRQEFPQSILLRSEDYSSFRDSGYLVTVVAVPFPSAAEANAWCDSAGRGPDDCFAKRISHVDGPSGSTVHR